MTAFLANENISRATVEVLRANDHDVKWVSESLPSVKDELVLDVARAEQRIIVTFDSDYGEMIYRRGMSPPRGIIFLRINSDDPAYPASLILKYLSISEEIFDNKFSVISKSGLRYKLL